jgi:hypothetical protein
MNFQNHKAYLIFYICKNENCLYNFHVFMYKDYFIQITFLNILNAVIISSKIKIVFIFKDYFTIKSFFLNRQFRFH